MANPPSDQGIPLLTEVIEPQSKPDEEPPAAPTAARPAAPSAAPAPAAPAATSPAQASQTATTPPPVSRPPVTPAVAAGTTTVQARPLATPAPVVPSKPAEAAANPAPTAATQAQTSRTSVAMPDEPSSTASAATPAKTSIDAAVPAADTAQAGTWSDSELRDLENELRLRITRQVLGRIDFVLDHRVRNSVTEVVDAAIDTLAVEIKRGLHETLADIVARAVAQEISRLQSGKK